MKIVLQSAAWLVLPLAFLLCAQWPLRELVQAWSREANDLGQIVFALYAAVAVTAASRAGTHLAAYRAPNAEASHASQSGVRNAERTRAIALAACVLPWAAFVLWSAAPGVLASLAQLEKFPETLNPGFFIIKASAWLLALLAFIHALCQSFLGHKAPQPAP